MDQSSVKRISKRMNPCATALPRATLSSVASLKNGQVITMATLETVPDRKSKIMKRVSRNL